jgi:lipoprotein-releasing system permease protein
MSRLPFELLLALRYLRPKRTFVSVITLISVIGVALGVAVLIIVISVMTGFDQQMRDTLLGINAHLKVLTPGQTMTNYTEVMKLVAANPNVKGVAPTIVEQVLLRTQTRNGQGMGFAPTVRGVDPATEPSVSTLPRSIVEGKFDVAGRGIVIGSVLAQNLGVEVGDRVNIYSPEELARMEKSRTKEEQEAILPDEYQIRGIFDVGYYEYNALVVIVSLVNAQDLYGLGDSVQGIMVMVNDPFQATKIQRQLERALGPNYAVRTWLDDSPLLGAVLVEKRVMLYILFFIVLVAAFGITCTLITFIVMKTREIGLLKALGATNRQVMWVFIGQSLVVSLLGIVVGLSIGLLAVHYRNEFLEFMRRATGMELFPASIYSFSQLPAKIVISDILVICGGSMLICLAAAAFPARYASRLDPVEALRYE